MSVPLNDLLSEQQYQRDVDMTVVRRRAQQFDERLLLPLVANRRKDGRVMILDGQHRMLMLREMVNSA